MFGVLLKDISFSFSLRLGANFNFTLTSEKNDKVTPKTKRRCPSYRKRQSRRKAAFLQRTAEISSAKKSSANEDSAGEGTAPAPCPPPPPPPPPPSTPPPPPPPPPPSTESTRSIKFVGRKASLRPSFCQLDGKAGSVESIHESEVRHGDASSPSPTSSPPSTTPTPRASYDMRGWAPPIFSFGNGWTAIYNRK